jgi:hypothetical protein
VLAFAPIIRTTPMTITRITASMIAYSATSCPSVFRQSLCRSGRMSPSLHLEAGYYAKKFGETEWLESGGKPR